ncbi:MAG: class I SAM-dependent methyltransferase [Bacteroidales bacterium]|nr:class I SAM-dependent methyltransferase [Bacteroidales bacterium]
MYLSRNQKAFAMTTCPLCYHREEFETLKGIDKKGYFYCPVCKLVFSFPEHLPGPEEEKSRYLTHNNGIEDQGYVRFLNQVVEPAMDYLEAGMECLDFGCGPAPTLSILVERQGLVCDNYDPLFFPDLPDKMYDAIFATECFEHFYHPAKELKTITSHLKKKGYLILMTQLWKGLDRFHLWHYTNDDTHVTFYHRETIDFIAEHFGFGKMQLINNRIIILQKTD